VCIEVIEHLPKKKGKSLIKEMTRVSRQKVILTTPDIFFKIRNQKFGHVSVDSERIKESRI
jgi:hypothetical protein